MVTVAYWPQKLLECRFSLHAWPLLIIIICAAIFNSKGFAASPNSQSHKGEREGPLYLARGTLSSVYIHGNISKPLELILGVSLLLLVTATHT